MAWHVIPQMEKDFGNSPCSQERGGASSEDCSADFVPCAPLKSTPSVGKSSCGGSWMDAYQRSLSGMTCEPLTGSRGEDLSTSSQADSLAKTFHAQEEEKESKGNDPACGQKWPVSLAKYDRDSRLWKTHQCLLLGGLAEFSETWPRWGMMRDGECWEQTMSEGFISASEYGYMVPTPTSVDYEGAGRTIRSMRTGRGPGNNLRDYLSLKHGWLYPPVVISESLMGWPIGWTDLKPLGMDKFQAWLDSHGKH